jgi:predicted small secreted protein
MYKVTTIFRLFNMESGKMIKKMILVAVLIAAIFALVGCQTVAGVGGDIKWTADSCANLLGGGN